MLGTDGNPLLSANGNIVLADDLYPMVPTQQVVGYTRVAELVKPECAAVAIWDAVWGDAGVGYALTEYNAVDDNSYASQGVMQVTFDNNSIDWSRVRKLTLVVSLSGGFSGGTSGRITVSKNNVTPPTGKTIRDTWETLFSFAESFNPILRTLEWEINGVQPDSLEVAVCIDDDTCPSEDKSAALVASIQRPFTLEPVRIVYNLAT